MREKLLQNPLPIDRVAARVVRPAAEENVWLPKPKVASNVPPPGSVFATAPLSRAALLSMPQLAEVAGKLSFRWYVVRCQHRVKSKLRNTMTDCRTCKHKAQPQGGWCYMFRTQPTGDCAKHAFEAGAGYRLYRGKCKEMSEQACKADPSLTLVRGHYFCPIWRVEEAHWWTVRPDGSIHDPTKDQFPSQGRGVYTPFNGMVTCEECGTEVPEDKASILGNGNYGFCSGKCAGRFVGVYVD